MLLKMENKLRIIGGEWRSRQLKFSPELGLRPTPARIRETLFNWLRHDILGRDCLDLYAGSGALGFEAASRGAKSVTQVEQNSIACQHLAANAMVLKANQIKCCQTEVIHFLDGNIQAVDVVFLDPPFSKNLAIQTCQCLEDKGWLKANAKIYLEVEAELELTQMPPTWKCLQHKIAGKVGYYLFTRET